ncbi:hypothetical protein FIBSPDRAFT_829233 [Athelia psychrophila]|uniref:Uncharacterized protein n=1 Tax=Athelia psychrophila TaxID=1759441 RepID=A0A166HA67_9AGAM|nr:hypothetical protein FIBSPDRAFT_829233 [Fibularhizoctonia sp. CBS 109695]
MLPVTDPSQPTTAVDTAPATATSTSVPAHSAAAIANTQLPPTPGPPPASKAQEPVLTSQLPQHTAPSGNAAATAALTDADLPDTENMIQTAGDAARGHEDGIEAVGWKKDHGDVPAPLIKRLPNEQLWQLIRRFDMQMHHVKAAPGPVPGGLDLNIAEEEEFSPDKLRANFERLYMTAVVGLAALAKHVARLRSWRERRRSAAFLAAYTAAWLLTLVLPLLLALLIALIVCPRARAALFPPAPLALVGARTGGLQGKAGELGSGDSLTGAPEAHGGEAVEAEAANFVAGVASIALSSVAGKGGREAEAGRGDGAGAGELEEKLPDPSAIALGAGAAKRGADGGEGKRDATKVPVQDAMWAKARPLMRGVADLADGWERFANALSPTPPFHANRARLRLAAVLVPLVFVAYFVKPAFVAKTMGALVGFGFFGQPVIDVGIKTLNEKVPNWPQYLELRNSLLLGVPTNAQLTLTLLRIAEENKAPLPPPPSASGIDPPAKSASRPALPYDLPPHNTDNTDPPAPHGHRITSLLKSAARGAVGGVLGLDRVKASAGSEAAKARLGVLPAAGKGARAREEDGPVEYAARMGGGRGWVCLATNAVSPSVSFARDSKVRNVLGVVGEAAERDPVMSIALSDIREIKKLGGLGWKAKLVVGFALGMETADGLEIVYVDRSAEGAEEKGEQGDGAVIGGEKMARVKFMAMLRRDELFNRLIALGDRKWESW